MKKPLPLKEFKKKKRNVEMLIEADNGDQQQADQMRFYMGS